MASVSARAASARCAETRVERRGAARRPARRFARCDDAIRMSSDEPSASLAPRDRRSAAGRRAGAGATDAEDTEANMIAAARLRRGARGSGPCAGRSVVVVLLVASSVGFFATSAVRPTTRLADWVCLTLARASRSANPASPRWRTARLPTRTSRWEERSVSPWTMRCVHSRDSPRRERLVAWRPVRTTPPPRIAFPTHRVALAVPSISPRVRTPPSRPSAETSLSRRRR